MKLVRFEAANCAEFRLHLDSYVSGELLTESSLAMLHHAASCPFCAQLYRQRLQLRAALRRAVSAAGEAPPAGLESRIRQALRGSPPP